MFRYPKGNCQRNDFSMNLKHSFLSVGVTAKIHYHYMKYSSRDLGIWHLIEGVIVCYRRGVELLWVDKVTSGDEVCHKIYHTYCLS